MKTLLTVSILTLAFIAVAVSARAQSSAFTYHGRLNNNGTPVTGAYDMQFSVYDADAAGQLVAGPVSLNALGVANGLFQARIDFGAGVFTGPARWLEIQVRPAGNGNYETLSPRQELTSSPYAIRAQTAGTAADVSNGSVVKSLNSLRDDVALAAGANVTIAPNGNTLTISSTGPGGTVWSLNGANAFYNAGNVGIGSSAPNHRLRISGGPGWTANGWAGAMEIDNASAIGWRGNAAGNRFGIGQSIGGLYFFNTASDPGNTANAANYVMTLSDAGNVGFGTTSPASKIDIAAQDALRIAGFQPFITMSDLNGFGLIRKANRYLQVVDGDLAFLYRPECNTFPCTQAVESHMTIRFNGNVGIGTSLPQAKLDVIGTTRTSVLTITGGADIAEPFKMSSPEIPKGSVVVIDETNPGHLKLSNEAYDTRVAGIVSGANGIRPGISLHQEGAIEGGENVALSGRVYVHADAEFGDIKPGDLLTTSETPGHAMKVTDHAKAQGAILGKAMTGLKEGKGMVLVLVTLQ
jgi:hypothetical protein